MGVSHYVMLSNGDVYRRSLSLDQNDFTNSFFHYMGIKELATESFELSREILERRLSESPDDSRFHGSLGVAYAGLGRKKDAIRHGKTSTELYPMSLDAFQGYRRVVELACIYTMVGEHDLALNELESLLSIHSFFSINNLRLNPIWDPLRDQSSYQALMKKYGS